MGAGVSLMCTESLPATVRGGVGASRFTKVIVASSLLLVRLAGLVVPLGGQVTSGTIFGLG